MLLGFSVYHHPDFQHIVKIGILFAILNIIMEEKNTTQIYTENSLVNGDTQMLRGAPENTFPQKGDVISQTSQKKLYVVLAILFVLAVAVALFVFIQARLDSFETVTFNPADIDTEFIETNDTSGLEEVMLDQSNVSFVDCVLPFVQIDSPKGGEVFMYGDTIIFDWSMCGISQSLFDNAIISYADADTGMKQGEIDLSCTDAVFDFSETQISWVVPERLSPTNYSCPLPGVIDFRDGFLYSFEISYARSQYTSVTPGTFALDITNFVFEPPTFSRYPIQTTDFSRTLLVDSSVPDVFQERISPAFFQAPTNFANFYRTFQLSCGPNCVSENILVDFRTGTIVIAPRALAILTAVDSSLFITEDTSYDNLQDRDALVSWYDFAEDTKIFSLFERKLCNVSGLPTSRSYTDCIEP